MNPSSQIIDALAEALAPKLGIKYKHSSPSGTPSTPYYTGPGGLFGVDGLERDLISTRVQPVGMASMLPVRPTNRINPLFPYLTGFLDVTGTNPNGVCDDAQIAGPGKSCIQTAQFGRYSFMTRNMEVNRVGQQQDRGEFQDLRLLNDPILTDLGSMMQPGTPTNPSLAREMLMRFMEVGIAYQNKLSRQIWLGNPTNNSAGEGYREFPGLDILIGTDKVDALTNTNCPSLDSLIENFAYKKIDENGDNVVQWVTYIMRFLRNNADRMGFGLTEWVIAMRESLFYELTAVWPCAYLTSRCEFRTADGTIIQNVSANDQIAFRDAMRAGQYLTIDGRAIRVVFDDGIVEESNTDSARVTSGCFASDIYFLPLTVRGGFSVLYWEHLNYMDGPMQAIQDGNLSSYFWTDAGRFLWHAKPPTNWCVQFISKIEPRIILLTPHLAARLQNVQYCPLLHNREPYNDDPYFVDGGVTARTAPTRYADWGQVS